MVSARSIGVGLVTVPLRTWPILRPCLNRRRGGAVAHGSSCLVLKLNRLGSRFQAILFVSHNLIMWEGSKRSHARDAVEKKRPQNN